MKLFDGTIGKQYIGNSFGVEIDLSICHLMKDKAVFLP